MFLCSPIGWTMSQPQVAFAQCRAKFQPPYVLRCPVCSAASVQLCSFLSKFALLLQCKLQFAVLLSVQVGLQFPVYEVCMAASANVENVYQLKIFKCNVIFIHIEGSIDIEVFIVTEIFIVTEFFIDVEFYLAAQFSST